MTSKAEYLKRYMSGGGGDPAPDEDARKKKRRKKKDKTDGEVKVKQVGAGVRILDEDVDDWKRADDPATANPDEGPVVVDAKDIEDATDAKTGPYLGIKEDGSGWAVAEDPRTDEKIVAADDDLSPPRARGRHDSDDSDDDLSPPRAGRRDTDDEEDLATTKGGSRSHVGDEEGADLSPPRAGRRHDSDDDLSPPRARNRHDSDDDEDLSPPRVRRNISPGGGAGEPSRRGTAIETRTVTLGESPDLSPPRRERGGASPARPATHSSYAPTEHETRAEQKNEPLSSSRRGVMTDGTTAGLVDAKDVVREADEKREAFKKRVTQMSAETSGKDAQTVYRDKATGKLVDLEELKRRRELAIKQPERLRPVWAQGIAQEREQRERREALEEEKKAPFARSEIDAKADAAMRAASRFGDPMAHLNMRKRLNGSLDDVHASSRDMVAGVDKDALEKSGFRIPKEVPAHSWMRRGVGAPPNRFSIKPGRHWDGVDRGTGFEQEMFKAMNDRSAKRQADWKYGQSMWE